MDPLYSQGLGISLTDDYVGTILTNFILNNKESTTTRAELDGIYQTENFYSFFSVSRYMIQEYIFGGAVRSSYNKNNFQN